LQHLSILLSEENEMVDEAAHLIEADRHLAQLRSFIRKQEQLIAKLDLGGHDTADAMNFLGLLTSTLTVQENHRTLILDNLARISGPGSPCRHA
jgi:hypothetical protein